MEHWVWGAKLQRNETWYWQEITRNISLSGWGSNSQPHKLDIERQWCTFIVSVMIGQYSHNILQTRFSFSLGSRLNQGGRLDTAHWDYQISGITLGPWAWHRSCAIQTILLNSWCPHMTLSTVTWSNPIEDSWCSHMVCTKDVICRDLFAWQLHHQSLVINTQSTEAKLILKISSDTIIIPCLCMLHCTPGVNVDCSYLAPLGVFFQWSRDVTLTFLVLFHFSYGHTANMQSH